jgi:glyoxylase-like metal-dependent hydrolase (beta-lactamase superfamily II)
MLHEDPATGRATNRMTVGNIEVLGVSDGYFLVEEQMLGSSIDPIGGYNSLILDYQPPRLPVGCFLIRAERNILIDTGYGSGRYDDGRLLSGGQLLGRLAELGLRPDDIDVVLLTHLHEDHSGTIGDRRTGEPVFTKARVFVGAADWAHFVDRTPDLLPIDESLVAALRTLDRRGQIEFLDGDVDITPFLRRIATPGHTPGHSVYAVHNSGDRLLILGDAMYCPQQLSNTDWEVAFDFDPNLARITRERLARDLERHGGGAVGCHFPELKMARVLGR